MCRQIVKSDIAEMFVDKVQIHVFVTSFKRQNGVAIDASYRMLSSGFQNCYCCFIQHDFLALAVWARPFEFALYQR